MNHDRILLILFASVFAVYLILDNTLSETRGKPVRYVVKSFAHDEGPKEYEYEIEEENLEIYSNSTDSIQQNSTNYDIFSKCRLTVFDPFHKDIGGTILFKNPIAGCNKRYTPVTRLENRILTIQPFRTEAKLCRYRCHHYVNVTSHSTDEWQYFRKTERKTVDCDFVRTECFDGQNKSIDQMLHAQIAETTKSTVQQVTKLNENFRKPDIHIIVVDSVSSTQARRSLPRTLSYLQNELKAVQFHHLNKVGDNSLPNGYAFLLGWRIVASKRLSVEAEDLEPLYSMDQVCNQYHDNDSVIFREFERIGYKTFYSEEYIQGSTFTYPKCKGFKDQEANHLFRPFVSTHNKESSLKLFMNIKNCFEMHQAQLDYHGQFIKAYKGKPKFGLTWIGAMAHDDTNALFHTDEGFEKFFKQNVDHLENSFIFFMGDHGMRVGATLRTELGKRELSNPMFLMVLPKWLRENQQLMKNLNINSRKLQTQFDVHATLLDLLNMTITNEFDNFTERAIFPEGKNLNNATSLFRPMGKFSERNCKNIPTDFSYCLCEYKTAKFSDSNLEKGFAEFGVSEINKILDEKKLMGKCDKLKLRKVESTIVYLPANLTHLYITTFTAEPGSGEFKMAVRVEGDGGLRRASDIERLDSFGTQPRCIEGSHPELRPLCHCSNQIFG